MSYTIGQINTALADADVQASITKKNAKSTEISNYTATISQINAQIANLNDRLTEITKLKTQAESDLAKMDADIQTTALKVLKSKK